MIRRVWQLRSVFLLVGLALAFATCVKKKDPNVARDELRVKLGEISEIVNQKNLGLLAEQFMRTPESGKGPNAFLAEIGLKADSLFEMHKRKVSIDGNEAAVRFTFSNNQDDSLFSYIYLRDDGGWKIVNFEIH